MREAPPLGSDRRIPNEISALIFDNLRDDFPSLMNIALVCKDFAYLARTHIFRKISLSSYRETFDTFVALLRESSIANFIRTLEILYADLYPGKAAVILQGLPYLTEIEITLPTSKHLQIIGTNFGGRLRELQIGELDLRHPEDIQRMLDSLVVLNTLVIRSVYSTAEGALDIPLILPKSLKLVYLNDVSSDILRSIGKGMALQPLMLDAFLVSTHSLVDWTRILHGAMDASRIPELWAGLGSHVPVVLVVEKHSDIEELESMEDLMHGLKVTQLLFSCHDINSLAVFLTVLIPIFPHSLRRVCIDLDGCVSYRRFTPDWRSMDAAFCKRHKEGLLEHARFRCTMRAHPFGFLADYYQDPFNRSVLDYVEELLPESTKLGFIQVDYDTMVFKPTL